MEIHNRAPSISARVRMARSLPELALGTPLPLVRLLSIHDVDKLVGVLKGPRKIMTDEDYPVFTMEKRQK